MQVGAAVCRTGKNPVNIYRKAYEQFALDPLAALNYANALLKYEKDADKALIILDTIKSDSRSVYPMAIAHNMKGNWRKAEELLKNTWNPENENSRLSMPGLTDK